MNGLARLLPLLVATAAAAQQQFAEIGKTHLPVDEQDTREIAVGDVDGDGDDDLVCGGTDHNLLFLNDGAGHFTDVSATHLPRATLVTQAIELADFDRDGDLDLFIGTDWQHRLYLNDGRGRFTDVTSSRMPQTRGLEVRAAAAGDLDQDGDVDVVLGTGVATSGAPLTNEVFVNVGGAFVREPQRLPTEFEECESVALADVDGDGDLDLAAGFPGSRPTATRLYLNDGSGFFQRSSGMPPSVHESFDLAFVDVDGDGDPDLVCGNDAGIRAAQNTLYLNDGSGTFRDATAARLPALADNTQAVTAGDVDGDGDLDLLFGNRGRAVQFRTTGEQDRLLLNDGTGRFVEVALPSVAEVTRDVVLVDAERDGDLDVVTASGAVCVYAGCPGRNRFYLNVGGAFVEGTTSRLPRDRYSAYAAELFDADGDGDRDLLVAGGVGVIGGAGDRNRLYTNDGDGRFVDRSSQLPADVEPTLGLAVGDVDGDGDLDAFCANRGTVPGSGQNRLYRNDGTGTFADVSATQLPQQLQMSIAAAFGDVDGDGDLDLLIANFLRQPNQLWLNDGQGRFADAPARMPADADDTHDVALVDVDADGDLDLVAANAWGTSKLYLNDGGGRFGTSVASFPVDGSQTWAVAAGDVDGDGDVDLVFANGLSSAPAANQNQLYLNDGNGGFADATSRLPRATDPTVAVELVDLDEDGDLDLLFGNDISPAGGYDAAYVNDGTGRFADATGTLIGIRRDRSIDFACGDVDDDGDPDIVVATWGDNLQFVNRLLFNRLRQVTTPVLLRTGARYEWVFHAHAGAAPPGQVVLPAISFARLAQPIVVPPAGSWHLDPALSIVLPPVGIPAGRGEASSSIAVPAIPGLVGLGVYTQAIVAHGAPVSTWRFTNVEVDVVHP